eukprot:SAG31_NODE_2597_length_5420_cov_16.255403_6_plen_81_part_00
MRQTSKTPATLVTTDNIKDCPPTKRLKPTSPDFGRVPVGSPPNVMVAKMVAYTVLRCSLQFIDLEGRCDGNDLLMCEKKG